MTPCAVAAAVTVGDCDRFGSLASGWNGFARPKSSTLTVPSSRTLMLAGFRSRWITPASCATSNASAICLAIGSASSTGIGPLAIRSARVGPSTSSSTSARVPSASSMPWICAMFGWLRLARTCASRWNRANRSGSVAKASGRIFRATWRLSWVSVACQTCHRVGRRLPVLEDNVCVLCSPPAFAAVPQYLVLAPVVLGRIPDFPVTRSHPPASWPSAANSSICWTYRKTAGEESRRRSPVANRWMRP